MSYILNIETATRNCSVALAKGVEILSLREVADQGYAHAEKLHVFIQEALDEAGIGFADLAAIAVSQGPGSYTGLRIGVSAAKGLAYALGIPLIATDTMESLAHQLAGGLAENAVIIPMIDARRMEAYTAVFDAKGQRIRETLPEIITQESFAAYDGPVYIVGDCQSKCAPVLSGPKFVFVEGKEFPSAREMAKMSFAKYEISDTVDVAYFEPFYLKEFFVGNKS